MISYFFAGQINLNYNKVRGMNRNHEKVDLHFHLVFLIN